MSSEDSEGRPEESVTDGTPERAKSGGGTDDEIVNGDAGDGDGTQEGEVPTDTRYQLELLKSVREKLELVSPSVLV
jgi:hypothetical protein